MATLKNDGNKQDSFRTLGSTTGTFNSDALAGMIADEAGLTATTYNGRLFEWLGLKGQSENTLQGRKNGFAVAQGYTSWQNMKTFTIA
jgi:hypothetical protein